MPYSWVQSMQYMILSRWTWFLVDESINLGEGWPNENFTIRLNQLWCDCENFKKLDMFSSHVIVTCKIVHHDYMSYIHLVYTLEQCFKTWIDPVGRTVTRRSDQVESYIRSIVLSIHSDPTKFAVKPMTRWSGLGHLSFFFSPCSSKWCCFKPFKKLSWVLASLGSPSSRSLVMPRSLHFKWKAMLNMKLQWEILHRSLMKEFQKMEIT